MNAVKLSAVLAYVFRLNNKEPMTVSVIWVPSSFTRKKSEHLPRVDDG
jgi:hypothetical protein